ncbi:hypothetical protein HNV12_04550 [Methanococcoides sp. SA1]|nr:hypothetical protein [Methanococcoides sp. SA1]
MTIRNISKKQAQYVGYSIFIFLFVLIAFPLLIPMGFKMLILVPLAFAIGMVGYWLGGFIHRRMSE